MLNQDPQKKISGITNRPRPVSVQDLNKSTSTQPSKGSDLGPKPNLAAKAVTQPQGTPGDLGASTPPEEKKGFLAAMKQKLTKAGKTHLMEKITGETAPEGEGPSRQVDTKGTPATNLGKKPPMADRPKPEVPKTGTSPRPQRPQLPKFKANIPKRPKIG